MVVETNERKYNERKIDVKDNIADAIEHEIMKGREAIAELEKKIASIKNQSPPNGVKYCKSCETYSLMFTGEILYVDKGFDTSALKKYSCQHPECKGLNIFSYYTD